MIKPLTNGVTCNNDQTKLSSLSDLLKLRFGLSKKQVEEVMVFYDEQYIREKINIIESSVSYIEGKITNLAKYLLSALKDDYQSIKSSKNVLKKPQIHDQGLGKNGISDKTEAYRRFQHNEIMKLFNGQTKINQKNILIEFEKQLGKSIYRDIYLRDRLTNILIQDQLCLFIKQKMPELINKIPSYHEFVS